MILDDPLVLLVVIVLAVYRGTLLVTGDRITRTPRRRLRKWLRQRSHRSVSSSVHPVHRTLDGGVCSCKWALTVSELATTVRHRWQVVTVQPGGGNRVHDTAPTPEQAAHTAADLIQAHASDAADTSRLGFLLECPWCVSIYLGTVAAVVYGRWPHGWWRWPALAMAASAVTGLLATIAAPDENDHED